MIFQFNAEYGTFFLQDDQKMDETSGFQNSVFSPLLLDSVKLPWTIL